MGSEQREWGQVFESLDDNSLTVLPKERYTVHKEVGRGGAKIVYRATDNNSGREVAYIQPLHNDENKRDLFMREARITAYLQHPNILPVYDVSGEDDTFFVCKLLRGKTLSDIRPKQHSLTEKISLFRKICEAIEYGHSRGVLHLDLKPANIRLDKYGEVLVIDWGLAEIFCTEGIESPLDNPMISEHERSARDYTSLGTPGYMSPEQIGSGKVDIKTDIFSLGALLYFMFHMKAPFRGKKIDNVFDNTLKGRFEFKSDELSSGLKSIITKCLSVNPENRYDSVSELIKDLEAVEQDYVPEAENATFFKHLLLLYKRNRLISNLAIIFFALVVILHSRYINELSVSHTEAIQARKNAEHYLAEVLQKQQENKRLTKELSPRYFIQAQKHWDYYQLSQAIDNCDIALELDPKNQRAIELRAQLYFVTGRYKEADEIWSKRKNTSVYRRLASKVLKSQDPVAVIVDKGNYSLKLREIVLRVLLNEFMKNGNMEYLQRVIQLENPKLSKVNLKFKNGYLNLSKNPGLVNINFLGGMSYESLDLSYTNVDNLSALSGRDIKVLNLSNSDVWEFFSMEETKVKKLILGQTKVTSLWALMNMKIDELVVERKKGGKFASTLLTNLKKLKYINKHPVEFAFVKNIKIEEIDISQATMKNPYVLMRFPKLKKAIVNKENFPNDLIEKLKKKGVEVIQSNSSRKR